MASGFPAAEPHWQQGGWGETPLCFLPARRPEPAAGLRLPICPHSLRPSPARANHNDSTRGSTLSMGQGPHHRCSRLLDPETLTVFLTEDSEKVAEPGDTSGNSTREARATAGTGYLWLWSWFGGSKGQGGTTPHGCSHGPSDSSPQTNSLRAQVPSMRGCSVANNLLQVAWMPRHCCHPTLPGTPRRTPSACMQWRSAGSSRMAPLLLLSLGGHRKSYRFGRKMVQSSETRKTWQGHKHHCHMIVTQ